MGFEPGFEIEVCSNEEGYEDAWFEAKVLKQLTKYQRYNIQYTAFVSESVSNKLLEDTVHISYVRPRPPKPSRTSRFEKHQLVEAMHNGAWWKGVISEVTNSKRSYRVCFPSSREEYEFEKEDLRVQLDWIKGDWVLSQMEDTGTKYNIGNSVEVSMDKENYGAIWCAGTILKVIGKNYLLVRYDSIKENDDNDNVIYLEEIIDSQYIRTSPPSLLSLNKSFEVSAEVEAFQYGRWVTAVILEVRPGLKYLVKSKHQEEIELGQNELRHKMELKNNKWVHLSKVKPSRSSGHKRKSMGVKASNISISEPTFGNYENADVSKVDILGVESGADNSEPIKMSNDLSLEAHLKLTDGIRSTSDPQRNGKTNSIVPRSKPLCYRRRTRHPNIKAQSSNITGEESFTVSVPALENQSSVNAQHNSPSQLEIKTDLTEENKAGLLSQPMPKAAHSRCTPSEQGAADIILIADLDNYKACRGLTKITDIQKKELGISAPKLEINSSDVFEQENTAKCTRHKPTIISDISEDAAKVERTTINPNKHSSTGSSISKEIDLNRESDQNSNIELPYIKESPVWEIVESMDVFKTLPQKPHFHALEQYKLEFREGMAIGLMVTFARLVDSIKKMKITDTRDAFEEKLKALVPLEENGFDVQAVRSRLKKLLDIRDRAHISGRKRVDLKEKLRERDEEKEQLDMLVAVHDKAIVELEGNLSRFRQKRESLVVRIDKKDLERDRLKVDFQATEDALVFAEDIFNAAVSSML